MLEVSAGIIHDGNRILCFRKGESRRPYLSHRYEFPGGKLESGETPAQALVREFQEELRLPIEEESLEFLCTLDHAYPDFEVRIHAFLVPFQGTDPVLTEHEDMTWSPLSKLHELDWVEADLRIIPKVVDHLA